MIGLTASYQRFEKGVIKWHLWEDLMKAFMLILSMISFLACSSSQQEWDSGAQRQEALLDESRGGIDESAKDQFSKSQPF